MPRTIQSRSENLKMNISFMAARYRACIHSRSSFLWLRAIALAFTAAHLFYGCALSRLHSQPINSFIAARYRACIHSRSSLLWLRASALAFTAAHLFYGCALARLHSQPLIFFMAAR